MAEDKRTLAERLAAVSAEVQRLGHDGQMQGGGSYKYTSINAIADVARPLLAKHGVTLIPGDVEVISHEALTKGYHVVIRRHWFITAPAGDGFSTQSIGASSDSSDKAYNKAHTYARKNLLVDLLNLSTGEDPDSERPETTQRAAPREPSLTPRGHHTGGARKGMTRWEELVAYGESLKLSFNTIEKTMESLFGKKSGPAILNEGDNFQQAKDALKGSLGPDDKGGLPADAPIKERPEKVKVDSKTGEVTTKPSDLIKDRGESDG